MDQKDRVVLEEWLSLAEAARVPATQYWPARLVYERYVERTGRHRDGGEAAVELLREKVIEVTNRMRQRALEKHVKQSRASLP